MIIPAICVAVKSLSLLDYIITLATWCNDRYDLTTILQPNPQSDPKNFDTKHFIVLYTSVFVITNRIVPDICEAMTRIVTRRSNFAIWKLEMTIRRFYNIMQYINLNLFCKTHLLSSKL